MSAVEQQLIDAYRQMADHTVGECAQCKVPFSCCDPLYCHFAIGWAKDKWAIVLTPTDHPTLPMMGPNGCTADPHLRPLCTVHTCDISYYGCHKNDPAWTKRYFELRELLDKLEGQRATEGERQ